MGSHQNWFEVDKRGLSQIVGARGKEFVLYELFQNAFDEDTREVSAEVTQEYGTQYTIRVRDDNPEGFKDLRHAYTLYAPSGKKGDPTATVTLGDLIYVLTMCKTEMV